jgi:hypothetical protein
MASKYAISVAALLFGASPSLAQGGGGGDADMALLVLTPLGLP